MKTYLPILVVALVVVSLLAAGCDTARPFAAYETPTTGKQPTFTPKIIASGDATATASAAVKTPALTPVSGTPVGPATTPVIPTAAPPGTPIIPTAAPPGTSVVPTAGPSGPVTPPATGEVVYVVKYGDTLSGIAWRYGVTWQAIAERNNLANPRLIYVGQRLIIPAGSGQPGPDGTVVHVVQAGETLWSIAAKYGVTWQAIAQRNSLANPRLIYVGQRLIIPKS
jgi:LysM repeat protein